MKKLLLITVAVTITSSYLRANEDKGSGHWTNIKEKVLTTAESAEPTINKKKNNVVNTVNSVHQAEVQPQRKQFFQNFKQGHTAPIAIAILVGLTTGGISGTIVRKIELESLLWIPLWIIESKIREAIITDLQNNVNQDDIQLRKKSMQNCAWLSSWAAYLFVIHKRVLPKR